MIFWIAKRLALAGERHRFRSVAVMIAVTGIVFATAAVVVTLGVLSGYQNVYRDAVLNFNSHLIVFHEAGLSDSDQKRIETFLSQSPLKHIYSPYHFYETLAPTLTGFRPAIFKGIDFTKLSKLYPISFNKFKKSATTDPEILVGRDWMNLKSELKNNEFHFLKLRDETGRLHTRHSTLKVTGTFSSGYYDFDSRFVLMPLKDLLSTFSLSPMVSGYEIRLLDFEDVPTLKTALEQEFMGEFNVMSWDELNASLLEALAVDRTVVFAVSTLILLVACLNIFGFNFLFFIQRKREFMILSALGLSLRKLRFVLVVLSLSIGAGASIFGSALGLIGLMLLNSGHGLPLDPEVYFVDRVPVAWPWQWFLFLMIVAVGMCFLTSVLAGKAVIKRYMTANLSSS